MRKLMIGLTALLCSTSIVNAELEYDPCLVTIPPPEYRTVTEWPDAIIYTTKERVGRACGIPLSWVAYGCFVKYMDKVTIYIADTGSPSANVCVLVHELAHVQGWRHD